jgi:hypothetical protein
MALHGEGTTDKDQITEKERLPGDTNADRKCIAGKEVIVCPFVKPERSGEIPQPDFSLLKKINSKG